MNVAALPRIQMPSLVLIDHQNQLAEYSSALGYVHGHRITSNLNLLSKLHEIGMLPFESKAVYDYKRAMERTQRWKLPWHRSKWHMAHMRDYAAEIPMEVLKKAALLQDSGVSLYVDYFSRDREEYDGDPFLVVRNWDTWYHVAVWDEPGFKL